MKTTESIVVTVDRSGKTESRRICQARNGLRYIKVLDQNWSTRCVTPMP
jgi:hypothetical protein